MDWNPRPGDPGTKDPGLIFKTLTQDLGPEVREVRSRAKNLDPGSDICDQGLGSILRTVFDISCTNDFCHIEIFTTN